MSGAAIVRDCPFCRSPAVRMLDLRHVAGNFTVECTQCGACGPGAREAAAAAAAWNAAAPCAADPAVRKLVSLGTMAEDMRRDLVAAGADAAVTVVFAGGSGVGGYQGNAALDRDEMERATQAAVVQLFDEIAAGRRHTFRPEAPGTGRPM